MGAGADTYLMTSSKGVKVARVLTVEFGDFIIKGLLITQLIVLFDKELVGHQVAWLSENVPVVSNVQ